MTALILAAGGVTAYADPFGADDRSSTTNNGKRSVTLPNGDVVTIKPGGGISVTAADGKRDTGYVSPRSLDGSGDVVVIPSDKVADLAAGKADPRRYNVSALLRSGQTIAAKADVSALDDKKYGQFTPIESGEPGAGAEGQPVELKLTDHTGKPAADVLASYINVKTGADGEFTVADKPVTTTIDGTKSVTVDAGIEGAEAATLHQDTEIYTQASQGTARGIMTLAAENSSVHTIPVEEGATSSCAIHDWQHDAEYHGKSSDDAILVETETQEYRPGPGETVIGAGPFDPNLNGGYIARDGDDIFVLASHLENPAANEFVGADPATGTTKLSKDGEVIDEANRPSADMVVPKGDSGRYTLAIDTTMDTDVTAMGTKGFAEWEFDSEPTGEFTPIDLSSVVFDAEGLANGSAPAGGPQKFTLDYLPQLGAAEAKAENVTFEVSYDDGKTWKEVDVDREGNTASGTLEHPEGAEYVSYRTAATDDSGNKFNATSIRSYALTR